MKKFAAIAIASAALLGSQVANATLPSTLSGDVTVYKGLYLDCTLQIDTTTDSNGDQWSTITLSPGDYRCASLVFANNPYKATPGTGTVTFENVYVTTITAGDCSGNISADWDGTELFIDGAELAAADPATPPCFVWGILS